MGNFIGGFIGGFLGAIAGTMAYNWMKEGGVKFPTVVPQSYYIKRVLADNSGTQITQYLQADYATFGAIDTALQLSQKDANQVIAVLQNQMPNAVLSVESVNTQTQQIQGYGYTY